MNLDDLIGPVPQVATSQGSLWLHGLTGNNMGLMRRQTDLQSRGREALRHLVSLTEKRSLSDTPDLLPDAVAGALTDDEICAVADGFREELRRQFSSRDSQIKITDPKGIDESPLAYLGRVVGDEVAYHDAASKALWEKATAGAGGAVGKMFKDLKSHSDQLGKTLGQAKLMAQQPEPIFVRHEPPMAAMQHLAQERREERDWARVNLQMTTESAEMLKKLVDSGSAMMLRWDERDRKGDKHLRIQLWIAVGTLALTTVFSAWSTWYGRYTLLAYEYQVKKDETDAKTAAVAAAREERLVRVLEQNVALLQQNKLLISELAAKQAQPPRAAATTARKGK